MNLAAGWDLSGVGLISSPLRPSPEPRAFRVAEGVGGDGFGTRSVSRYSAWPPDGRQTQLSGPEGAETSAGQFPPGKGRRLAAVSFPQHPWVQQP